MRMAYPPAPRGDVVDDFHGTPVPDPYRWLEDPDAPQTVAWVEAQNTLTASFLGQGDVREHLRERLTRLWDYPRYGVPQREGRRYYFWKNSGLQNQPVLYAQPHLDAPEAAVLDPNTLSPDGTAAVLNLRFYPRRAPRRVRRLAQRKRLAGPPRAQPGRRVRLPGRHPLVQVRRHRLGPRRPRLLL